jgi:hypothetical protein
MAMCHRLLLWCCWNKEGDDNKLPLPFSLCLRRRRKKKTVWQRAVVFFYGGVLTKKAMETYCHHLLLLWCEGLIWWFLGVYRVHGTIKEDFRLRCNIAICILLVMR